MGRLGKLAFLNWRLIGGCGEGGRWFFLLQESLLLSRPRLFHQPSRHSYVRSHVRIRTYDRELKATGYLPGQAAADTIHNSSESAAVSGSRRKDDISFGNTPVRISIIIMPIVA
jgi:hypothetical protein